MSSPEAAATAARAAPAIADAVSARANALAGELEQALAEGRIDALAPDALQALMAALCKLYGANIEAGNAFPILSGSTIVTGTDVMLACGALLRAVNLQVFELGMWQSWTGR
jgi:hypothetical protein